MFAEKHRKRQIGLRHLRSVSFSLALPSWIKNFKRPISDWKPENIEDGEMTIKITFAILRGGALGKFEGKSSENTVFLGKRHDNKILKVRILLSRIFVVITQAPKLPENSQEFLPALVLKFGENSAPGGSRATVPQCLVLKPYIGFSGAWFPWKWSSIELDSCQWDKRRPTQWNSQETWGNVKERRWKIKENSKKSSEYHGSPI